MTARRIAQQPAYVLHHYDWSESSLILETFTRQHGRVALVAKGAKRPSSSLRPVLLPLQPLLLGWGGDAEIRTLKSAEWAGGHVMPTGQALLSGYYANELMTRILPCSTPTPRWCTPWPCTRALPDRLMCCTPPCAPLSCCCCAKPATCPR